MKEKINEAIEHCAKLLLVLQDIREDIEEREKKTVKINITSHFNEKVNDEDLSLDDEIEKFRKDLEEMLNDFAEKRES